MVRGLHALLVSDGYLLKDFFALLECHIEIEKCTNYFFADMDQVISATVVYFGVSNRQFGYFVLISFRSYDGIPLV